MKMQTYRYVGPLSSASLRVDGQIVDVVLNPRLPVALPPAHPYTQALLAQKRLLPLPAPAVAGTDASGKPPRGKGASA